MAIARFLEAHAVATANISLTGLAQTIDDIPVNTAGMWILVVGQSDKKQNGVYSAVAGGWTRPTEANDEPDLLGMTVVARKGTKYGDSIWQCVTDEPITIGNTDIIFRRLPDRRDDWLHTDLAKPIELVDANQGIDVTQGTHHTAPLGLLTADRYVRIRATGAVNGSTMTISRSDTSAHRLIVLDDGTAKALYDLSIPGRVHFVYDSSLSPPWTWLRSLDSAAPMVVDIKRFGAKGNGTANDSPAINAAIRAAMAGGSSVVLFPGGRDCLYRCADPIDPIPVAITLHGMGGPPGGVSASPTRFPTLLHAYDGDFIVFTGAGAGGGLADGSGGGVEGLRLVQANGPLVTMQGGPTLTFNAAARTIVRGDAASFITDGFVAGMRIAVMGARNDANNICGVVLATVAASTLTLVAGSVLVNEVGTAGCILGNVAGAAIKITGIDANHKASWTKLRELVIEESGVAPWSYALLIDGRKPDGTALGGILDLWISDVTTHVSAPGRAVRCFDALQPYFYNCGHSTGGPLGGGDIEITGTAGEKSRSVQFVNCHGHRIFLDHATDFSLVGGVWTDFFATANVNGTCRLEPSRLAAREFQASVLSNANIGVAMYDDTTVGNCAGSFRFSRSILLRVAQYLFAQKSGEKSGGSVAVMGYDGNIVRIDPYGDSAYGLAIGVMASILNATVGDITIAAGKALRASNAGNTTRILHTQ